MAAYKIFFRKSVLKDFDKIPDRDLKKIIKRIKNPFNNASSTWL